MNHPSLAIMGYSEAAMFLQGAPRPKVAAIISIHGSREYGVEADAKRRLDLTFDDVEVVPVDDVISMQRAMSRKRWAEQNGLFEVPPVPADVVSIIKFVESVRAASGIMLSHCAGGMSRAPAAALICLAVWRGPGSETDCVEEILNLRRGAVPHVGLIRFADEILGRKGKLISALATA